MHRAKLDSCPFVAHGFHYRLDYFEQKARTILKRAAVGVRPAIRRQVHELGDEIEVVSEDLYTVEACLDRVPGGHGHSRAPWFGSPP